MLFNEFINHRRKEMNLTVDELVERSGLPKGTVSKITADINQNPKLSTIEALCRALHCSLDDALGLSAAPADAFTRREKEFVKKYRTLDEYGREMMDSVLEIEYRRCRPALRMLALPFYAMSVSAGFGNPLDEAPSEKIEITDTTEHRQASFAVKISGDSMLPQFRDGDKVLVKEQQSVEIGEIGIFVLNGESFIKKLGVNELISLNPHYPPKPYSAADSIICCGKVLCKL